MEEANFLDISKFNTHRMMRNYEETGKKKTSVDSQDESSAESPPPESSDERSFETVSEVQSW